MLHGVSDPPCSVWAYNMFCLHAVLISSVELSQFLYSSVISVIYIYIIG